MLENRVDRYNRHICCIEPVKNLRPVNCAIESFDVDWLRIEQDTKLIFQSAGGKYPYTNPTIFGVLPRAESIPNCMKKPRVPLPTCTLMPWSARSRYARSSDARVPPSSPVLDGQIE